MIRPKAYFDNGFSLAELLVVIVIIGVLGSVGIQILSRLFERIRAQRLVNFAALTRNAN